MGREYIRQVESPITSLEIGMRLRENWLQDNQSRTSREEGEKEPIGNNERDGRTRSR